MKFIVTILLILLLGYALGSYLPWWSIALAGFAVCAFLDTPPLQAFLAGFLAAALLWGGLSLLRSVPNTHILAQRFSALILGKEEPMMLIAVTALIGGLVTGLGALCGSYVRRLQSPADPA